MPPESSGAYETKTFIPGLGDVVIPGGEGFADRKDFLWKLGEAKLAELAAAKVEKKTEGESIQETQKPSMLKTALVEGDK